MGDGSLSIYLSEGERSTTTKRLIEAWNLQSGERSELPWIGDSSPFLTFYVLIDDRDEDRLFERQSDGRYAAVPRVERDLKFECGALPPENSQWSAGWSWRDQWGAFASVFPGTVGGVVRAHVSAPEGATFWWSACGRPPGVLGAPIDVGGTCPLEGVRKFVLR